MTSSRLFGLVLCSVLVPTLAASPALAERLACDIDADGARICDGVITCDERRDCISDVLSEDWYCTPASPARPDARECMAACTTMFGCGADSDCPAMGALIGTCQAAGDASAVRACTYRGTAPANRRITYCADGGATILGHYLSACHTRPRAVGDPAVYTPDYYQGDCDGDGCVNGADTDPCLVPSSGGTCMVSTEPAVSPFCPPPPPLACSPSPSGGVVCADARPCGDVAGCDSPAACEDGWSDGPRCRPECSTLILCHRPGAGGAVAELCPAFNGNVGACLPAPVAVPGYPGYDGVCVYSAFVDATCSSTTVSPACFLEVGSSTPTSDFYRGDCDSDGVPNGCDATRCEADGIFSECVDAPGVGCGAMPPPPDAGVEDAGVDPNTDAAVVDGDAGAQDDGGVSDSDAGPAGDGGNAAFDAGSVAEDASGGSFSGGGGCRCSAVGGDRGGAAGLGLAIIALGAVLVRRKRR